MGLRKSSLATSRGQFLVGLSRAPKMAPGFWSLCPTTPLICEGQDLNLETGWGQQVGTSDLSLLWWLALECHHPEPLS